MRVGDTLTFRRTFRDSDVEAFSEISGDRRGTTRCTLRRARPALHSPTNHQRRHRVGGCAREAAGHRDGVTDPLVRGPCRAPWHRKEEGQQGRLVCHGLLTLTTVTQLTSQIQLLGKGLCVDFIQPVRSGDTVICELRVRPPPCAGRAPPARQVTRATAAGSCVAAGTQVVDVKKGETAVLGQRRAVLRVKADADFHNQARGVPDHGGSRLRAVEAGCARSLAALAADTGSLAAARGQEGVRVARAVITGVIPDAVLDARQANSSSEAVPQQTRLGHSSAASPPAAAEVLVSRRGGAAGGGDGCGDAGWKATVRSRM